MLERVEIKKKNGAISKKTYAEMRRCIEGRLILNVGKFVIVRSIDAPRKAEDEGGEADAPIQAFNLSAARFHPPFVTAIYCSLH